MQVEACKQALFAFVCVRVPVCVGRCVCARAVPSYSSKNMQVNGCLSPVQIILRLH